jgi:hypothetical protein
LFIYRSAAETRARLGRYDREIMMNRRGPMMLALSLLLPVIAHAQDHPLFMPSKDVTVVYRLAGGDMGNGAQKLRVLYAGGGQREKIEYFRWVEAKYSFAAMILNRARDKLIAINDEERTYIETNIGKLVTPDMRFSSPDMHYTRLGIAAVAGQPCTDWTIQPLDNKVPGGTVCVTDDGLILRVTQTGIPGPGMIALSVDYGTPPDGTFAPPEGFMRKEPPSQ